MKKTILTFIFLFFVVGLFAQEKKQPHPITKKQPNPTGLNAKDSVMMKQLIIKDKQEEQETQELDYVKDIFSGKTVWNNAGVNDVIDVDHEIQH